MYYLYWAVTKIDKKSLSNVNDFDVDDYKIVVYVFYLNMQTGYWALYFVAS